MTGTRFLRWGDKPRVLFLLEQNRMDVEEKFGINTRTYHGSTLDSFLAPNCSRSLIGYFNSEDELTACVGLEEWDDMPCCTICFLFISPRYRKYFRPIESGYMACIEAAYSHCEKKGIYQYYYFQRNRPTKKGMDIWASNTTPIIKKYYSYQEAIIPAGTCPIWKKYWNIMECKVWPFDSEIRKICLKPEYFGQVQLNE